MAWCGGREGVGASCVCYNAGPENLGCWDSLQIHAEMLVIQTFRALTDSRVKTKSKLSI